MHKEIASRKWEGSRRICQNNMYMDQAATPAQHGRKHNVFISMAKCSTTKQTFSLHLQFLASRWNLEGKPELLLRLMVRKLRA